MSDLRTLCPRIDDAGAAVYHQLREHPDAPAWTHALGDRLREADMPRIEAFRASLGPVPTNPGALPIDAWRQTVPWLMGHTGEFEEIPLQSREDLVRHPERLIPVDADLDALIRYDTSGTTGTPVGVPSHPSVTAQTTVLIEEALRRNGVTLDLGPRPLVAHVCAQQRTWTFASVFTYWGQAGFVKVNLHPAWPREQARRYLEALDPQLVTGDPLAFAEVLAWDIGFRPRAFLSSATTFPLGLQDALRARYGSAVVDWYATTETGPIAASTPEGMRLLCPDLYVEIVDSEGFPVPDGTLGEIVVSGGRNPYLPLIRWRTGDHAKKSGEYLFDLQARAPVSWRAGDGSIVTPVDLAHAIRPHLLSAFHFREVAGDLLLTVRAIEGERLDMATIGADFERFLGRPVQVRLDPDLDPKRASWG
jgi:phenylacetate-CoA ligase